MNILIKGLVLSALFISLPSQALTLQQARAQGLVGETLSGYLAAVKDEPQARALVEKINAERTRYYQQIADENRVSRDQVAQLAGQKLVSRTPAGEYVRGLNGLWMKK